MKLDKYDKTIAQELVINPRLSDNKISRITEIPLKTVNRKRKRLEEKGIISYHAFINNGPDGTEDFTASVMYIIKFRYGIYRKQFLSAFQKMELTGIDTKHISFQWLGEKDGQLILLLMIESRQPTDILEIYNVEIVSKIGKSLGQDAISDTIAIPISTTLSLLHNYLPGRNMENGLIKKAWPKELVFVSDLIK